MIDMDTLLHTLYLRQNNVRTEAWPRVARDPYTFWILTGETAKIADFYLLLNCFSKVKKLIKSIAVHSKTAI